MEQEDDENRGFRERYFFSNLTVKSRTAEELESFGTKES
jgi:hypothetical protein